MSKDGSGFDWNLIHVVKHKHHLFQLSDDQRKLSLFEDVWVDYPAAINAFNMIHTVLHMPMKSQAQCILIAGAPGMGKTSLTDRLEKLYGWRPGNTEPSLVTLKLKERTDYKFFHYAVMETLCGGMRFSSGRLTDEVVTHALRLQNIRAIAIDEIQNINLATRHDIEKNFAFLKGGGGAPWHVSIIALGDLSAKDALQSDPQLARRFDEFLLRPWAESHELREWLAGLQQTLPLKKPSNLSGKAEVRFILRETRGNTDAIVKLISRAAIWSIIEGVEFVSIDMLERATEVRPPI